MKKIVFFLAANTSRENKKDKDVNCINKGKKIIWTNYNLSFKKNLTEKKGSNNIKKNKNCISVKMFKLPENNTYKKHNNIFRYNSSPLSTSRSNKNNFSRSYKDKSNIHISRNNTNIKLFKSYNKSKCIHLSPIKNKSRNAININLMKKKTSTYRTNIDNNINNLSKYTKNCNSLLLNLIRKNTIKKIKYVKKYLDNENKKLKQILSSNGTQKYNSDYLQNKIKQEKMKKMKILIKDTLLDYDMNKLLKEKTIHEKVNKNEHILRKYNMLSENIEFREINNTNDSRNKEFMRDKDDKKLKMNKKMKKLRDVLKKNSLTIKKLNSFIQIDKEKIMNNSKYKNKEEVNV